MAVASVGAGSSTAAPEAVSGDLSASNKLQLKLTAPLAF